MGGRVFIDKETGYNPVSRIPTAELRPAADLFIEKFGKHFSKIEFVSSPDLQKKEDHGDIDFVALPAHPNSREEFRKHLDALAAEEHKPRFVGDNDHEPEKSGTIDIWEGKPVYKWEANGRMDHVVFPYPGVSPRPLYQMDVIWANGKNDFRNKVFFYSNPTTFNAVLGHFARSIGYKFSDLGLHIHVTDRRKQNFFVFLTDNLEDMMKIMMLPIMDMNWLFEKPENFVGWIVSSPKFDSKLFVEYHNHRSHRDAKKDAFCEEVYRQIQETQISATVPPVRIDFSEEDPDLDEKLQIEKFFLGEKILQNVVEQIEERSKVATPVISGKELIELGFKPGPIFQTIIQDVSEKFSIEDDMAEKKAYVLEKWEDYLAS